GVTVICYIDAFSGLAGDMLVAALADAGADRDTITRSLRSLSTEGDISWENVRRRGMAAAKFRVTVAESSAHRHLSDILGLIGGAGLPDSVKSAASRVFQILGEAEAKAHGIDIEQV